MPFLVQIEQLQIGDAVEIGGDAEAHAPAMAAAFHGLHRIGPHSSRRLAEQPELRRIARRLGEAEMAEGVAR